MLRKPKILLMDEATSNIDPKTDKLIQKIIHDHFLNSTVLTIAHRIDSLVNYDRILVLEKGELVEDGTIEELYQKGGYFKKLVEKNGQNLE